MMMLTKHHSLDSLDKLELRSGINPLNEFVPAQSERVLLRGFILPEIIIKGRKVLYDECDEALVMSRKWNIHLGWGETPYVTSSKGIMHRLIMDCPKGFLVDHINHDTLDNRRENLRICTRSQNMWNRKKTCGSSVYKGVHLHKKRNKWRAEIYINNKRTFLGEFLCEHEAAIAYNKIAKEVFGEFACLNIIRK